MWTVAGPSSVVAWDDSHFLDDEAPCLQRFAHNRGMLIVTVFVVLVFAYSLVSRRLREHSHHGAAPFHRAVRRCCCFRSSSGAADPPQSVSADRETGL